MIYNSKQIKDVLKTKGYHFDTKKWKLNIIGVRLTNTTNLFNDVLYIIYTDNSGVEHIKEYKITTKPGNSYLKSPLSSKGTAILVPSQYKNAYAIGLHSGRYEALRQVKPITVYRDNTKDTIININPSSIDIGLFGVNIHRSNARSESTYVNKWSAGCQVFKRIVDYNEFMALARKSRKINNNSFTYTLLTKSDFDGYDAGTLTEAPNIVEQPNTTTQTTAASIEVPTFTTKQRTDKEIVNIFEAKGTTPLKFKQDNEDAITKPSEITGSLIPFVKYVTNNVEYTFTYQDIINFKLSYSKHLPTITVVIEDNKHQFTSTLFELTSDDRLVLYLKSNDNKYKSIYQTYNITNINWNEDTNTYVFNGVLNIPKLFTIYENNFKEYSSWQVFNQIATELDLGFNSNITSTNDTMNWLSCNHTLYEFLNYVCLYAYKDDDTFFDWFIDFYNNINFIEVNKQFGTYSKQSSVINKLFEHEYNGNEPLEIDGKNILTNLSIFKGTSNYISNFSIKNNITESLILKGDEFNVGFFDLDLKEFANFNILLSNNNDEEVTVKKDTDYKRTINLGYQDDISNVHSNFNYAKINNELNLNILNKTTQTLYLSGSNYMYYKYQNIPVGIYTAKRLNKDGLALKNGQSVGTLTNVNSVLLEQLSGYMVIYDIVYEWSSTDTNIKQIITVIKR